MQIPLAERMRPKALSNYIGQEHVIGEHSYIKKCIDLGNLPSLIFWGPPGTGKTTLAILLARSIDAQFFQLNAIHAGVKDIRDIIENAQTNRIQKTILFIDEIHRFNKSQQDALLNAVEKGIITLIGATTENPSFEIIQALLSRCQLITLKSLTNEQLLGIANNAIINDYELKKKNITIEEPEALLQLSGGDARKLLNTLEIVISSVTETNITITNNLVLDVIKEKIVVYDKAGENHYNIISAFIKSMRGSDPNAAVYYLARMIAGGEDPKFIARRMLVLASEDIGNANPNALLLANACFDAVSKIGMPESRIILSQCATYLASSPKSNASYMSINDAQALVNKTGDLAIPLHLRNAPTKMMKDMNYGKDYKYSHNYEVGNEQGNNEFLPAEIKGTTLYKPKQIGAEQKIAEYLKQVWKTKYDF